MTATTGFAIVNIGNGFTAATEFIMPGIDTDFTIAGRFVKIDCNPGVDAVMRLTAFVATRFGTTLQPPSGTENE